MPVSFLTDNERAQLQNFSEEIPFDDLNAYFTLSPTDMALVRKQRRAHNRLGFSLQLCALRYLGFVPRSMLFPDNAVAYIARQLRVSATDFQKYGNRNPTRTVDAQTIQAYLGFRKATAHDLRELSQWLLERSLEHDKPSLLFQLLREKLYQEKIVRPGITRLEKLIAAARAKAQAETYMRLRPLFTHGDVTLLDNLLLNQEAAHHTQLPWLGKGATSNSSSAIIANLEKLAFLHEHRVDTWDMSALTPNHIKFLAQIAKRSTNQAVQRMSEERRYPILLAFLHQSLTDVIDETIDMYDRCLWDCYSGARNDLEAFRKQTYKSANEKISVLQRVGALVLDPNVTDQELRQSIFAYLPKDMLRAVVDECAKIVRPVNDKYLDFLASRYSYLRQFVPKFLSSFVFQSNSKDDPLLKALDILRQLDAAKQCKVPNDAPLDFITDDWLPYVINKDKTINRRFYELSVLWELRSSLRAANVWVAHSRHYADPETYIIPKAKWETLRAEVCNQVHIPTSGTVRMEEKKRELTELLKSANAFLKGTGRGDVRIEQGKLIMPRLEEEELPGSAKQLQALITARLPRVELTDLLLEVGSWTNFPEHFEHAGGSQPRTSERLVYLYASILAQACNFGLHQMAHIAHLSYDKLAWYTKWYIREETLKPAFTTLVNHQFHQWLSQYWGDGSFSSSDGQRFLTVGKNRLASSIPRYFGYQQGITFYTWTSSQYSQFGTKPTRTTARDATYVLDEILGNESELPLANHTVDTAGFTEVDFALFSLLGRGFWPRLRDIGDQHLYRMDRAIKYPRLEPLLKGAINERLILDNYDEILRVAGSMQLGYVTASLLISKLQARPQQNMLTKVLQEYGRLEKTIFILRYIQDPAFRQEIHLQLNKGEQLHNLRQFLHFANEGKIRSHLEEEQINEASCLNLVTNAVVLWNTVYMQAIIEQLRSEGHYLADSDLKHIAPARFEHINPYGHYTFNVQQELERKGLRPLREA